MKKVILTLLVFVFSFAFINAQENAEKFSIKQECKMDKKECKGDCKFEDQKQKRRGHKMNMRQNVHRGHRNVAMTQDSTKSVHMKRKMMLERRSHSKRGQMEGQHMRRGRGQMEHMRGDRAELGEKRMELYLKKVHIEVSKELEAGEISKREGKKKIKEATEKIQKRMDMMEKITEEVEVEKNNGTWTKDNMYDLPMDEFANYIQYKE